MDQSCDMQLEDLRRYAQQRFGRCYEFVDEGVSGTQRRRPQLDALMNNARKRRFDVVVVWKFEADQPVKSAFSAKRFLAHGSHVQFTRVAA